MPSYYPAVEDDGLGVRAVKFLKRLPDFRLRRVDEWSEYRGVNGLLTVESVGVGLG